MELQVCHAAAELALIKYLYTGKLKKTTQSTRVICIKIEVETDKWFNTCALKTCFHKQCEVRDKLAYIRPRKAVHSYLDINVYM